MANFSKYTTSSPRSLADFSISWAIAKGKRSLRAKIATRFTSGARCRIIVASGFVSVSFGVKVPNKNL